MPHRPLIERHSGSSACGVTPQDASCAAYHTRTPERAPDRGGKRGVPWLHTGSVASFRLRRFVVWSLPPTHAAKEESDDGDQLQRGPFSQIILTGVIVRRRVE